MSLTDAQVKQILPTVERTANKVEALRQTIEPQIQKILDSEIEAIDKFLTPEQQKLHAKLIRKFKKRHEEMEKKRNKQK